MSDNAPEGPFTLWSVLTLTFSLHSQACPIKVSMEESEHRLASLGNSMAGRTDYAAFVRP